jgi:uncharacterized protein (TIGR01244 family)
MNLARTVVVTLLAAATGCAAPGHKAATTERLEPYTCGSIARLHTCQGIFLASQPTPADLEQARTGGVRTVINLRHAQEITDFDEAAVVRDLGLTYENPAWNGEAELTDGVFDELRRLLNTAERPLLLHCGSANRVGAVWLAWRALDGGLSDEEALAEARIVGLKTPAYQARAEAYVKARR